MIEINLDFTFTLILCITFLIIGSALKLKINFFNKFCIPAPVIGGLLFTFFNTILIILDISNIHIMNKITPFFMNVFFTILGLSASFKLIKKGGKLLFTYWFLCGVLALSQNIISVLVSKAIKINPLIGLMCGTISLEGGHGNAAAFGSTIENLGVENAVTVGLAAATIGVIVGGLIGAPVSRYLIIKHNLKPNKKLTYNNSKLRCFSSNKNRSFRTSNFDINTILEQILIILLCMSLGELITNLFYLKTNIVLPSVVGCMVVACFFRNINEFINVFKFNFDILDPISEISLSMFLILALMNINLIDLKNLAGPMLIIILVQILFILFYSIFICFKLLGKDFDAAVIISGLIGHGLGNTPNAIANMNSITSKYGLSEKALLIVPLVGAFLLDIFTIPTILIFINFFK
ncbi:sodium/glutamate symporter [Paraclostridium sordellii]|uniref:sodium/glutamate symporter n=1 Tax=Paraclostridium sordellii TaxID=1505 RepID=UPI000E4DE91D|nr:sodium/glutamate symporter [Paeniclostridium sordellii]RGX01117.1 sodium/glutamate symporter [Paeniclostridium sordellii]